MRLVDADALIAQIEENICKPCIERKEDYNRVRCRACQYGDEIDDIDSAPTIEPKKGMWIPGREVSRTFFGPSHVRIDYEDWRCSVCGCVVEQWWKPEYNFCPNCGADMRGEE